MHPERFDDWRTVINCVRVRATSRDANKTHKVKPGQLIDEYVINLEFLYLPSPSVNQIEEISFREEDVQSRIKADTSSDKMMVSHVLVEIAELDTSFALFASEYYRTNDRTGCVNKNETDFTSC